MPKFRSTFKQEVAAAEGYAAARDCHHPAIPVVRDVNEDDIKLDNMDCRALLDTGSSISTKSETFFKNFINSELHSLKDILKIECASGFNLQYFGYIIANLKAPNLKNTHYMDAIFLMVADTQYNKKVSVLLGTNILKTLTTRLQED